MQENPVFQMQKTIWAYNIDVEEAKESSEMTDDGRIMAFRYRQLLPSTW